MTPLHEVIRAEYVSGTESVRALVVKHGGKNYAGIAKRAIKEKWNDQRKSLRTELVARTTERVLTDRVDELAAFNQADLRLAKALRQQIAHHLNRAAASSPPKPLSPDTIRTLMQAVEAAQRVGRLALGASTQKNEVTGADGGPLEHAIVRVYMPSNGRD